MTKNQRKPALASAKEDKPPSNAASTGQQEAAQASDSRWSSDYILAEAEVGGLSFARTRSRVLLLSYHLSMPLLVLLFAWMVAVAPDTARHISATLHLPSPNRAFEHWTRALPPHALNRSHAWELGAAEGALAAAVQAGSGVKEAVRSACALLAHTSYPACTSTTAVATVTERLTAMRAVTAQMEQDAGAASFASRVFNLVNVMWAVATLGIMISIGPLARAVLVNLAALAKRLWRTIGCHMWRPALYFTAVSVLQGAGDESISGDVRAMTCLLVSLLVCGCWMHVLYQLVGVGALPRMRADAGTAVRFAFSTVLLAAVAHTTASPLTGFLSVTALYASMGSVMASIGRGYAIGFRDQTALLISCACSLVLIALQTAVRLGAGGPAAVRVMEPFSTGLQCYGATTLYLALLIWNGPFWSLKESRLAVTAAALAAGVTVGMLVPQMRSVANTAMVFSYLLGLDVITWAANKTRNLWLVIFTASVVGFAGAYWLHAHPHLVVALYSAV